MGYVMCSASCDKDDKEGFEEESCGGNQFLCFMFGNIDNSGNLDVDYLDEDAKEHLTAIADKLTNIDLFAKSSQTKADATKQGDVLDYDVKAVEAVDYEAIDELDEGPKIQAGSEEDYLLPKKEYFSSKVSVATLEPKSSVLDDENYDEDEEIEEEHAVSDQNFEDQAVFLSAEQGGCLPVFRGVENSTKDDLQLDSLDSEKLAVDINHFPEIQQEVDDTLKGPSDGKGSTPLPILCMEDGMVILRFSEIFGILNPLKKVEKRDHRCSLQKERCKVMNDSKIEEDEEAFLKGSGQGFSYVKKPHIIQHGVSVFNGDDSVLVNWGFVQGPAPISAQDDEQSKNSFLSAEPMKGDVTVNLSVGWQSPLCPKFNPLEQQDWEDRILWDYSPAVSDNSVESFEISAPELEALVNRDTEPETGPKNVGSELSMEPDEKDCNFFPHSSPVFLEAFGSRISLGSTGISFSESRCHPQLLRLDSLVEVNNCNVADGRSENVAVNRCQGDTMRQFSKLSLQNRDMLEGSWLDNIIWEPHEAIAKPKLILDLQDEHMLFEIMDNKDGEKFQLHAGAMIMTQSVKPSNGDSFDLDHRYQSSWRFNIAIDNNSNCNKHTAQSKDFHLAPTPMSSAMVKKRTAACQGISTVTGTDADLRRLSTEAAREVLLMFNVPEELISKQTRCQRIGMIRKLSSEDASGVKVKSTISKCARGQKKSFLQPQQQSGGKCQEIWDPHVIDGDRNESGSKADSDLDSFAGDLENFLDAEECGWEEGNCESNYDKEDDFKGLIMRKHPSQAQADKKIEDEAAELCRLLMEDDESEQKKKPKVLGDDVGLASGSPSTFGFEIAKSVKRIPCTSQPSGFYASKENITDPKENYKERKSSRENYSCTACGKLGHMKTNKNCPKYKEYQEARLQIRASLDTPNFISEVRFQETAPGLAKTATDMEKASEKSNSLDSSKAPEGEKFSSKVKVLPVKFKCGSNKLSDKLALGAAQCSGRLVTSDAETGNKSVVYVTKNIKPEDEEVGSHKPTIVIRPLRDSDRYQMDSRKPPVAVWPPSNAIPLSMEVGREQPNKKIIIKLPKEIIDLDQVSEDGTTGLENVKSFCSTKESTNRKAREERRWWEEEEKRRNAERQREERARRLYEEAMSRERPNKRIIIKLPKEIIDLDPVSQDGTTGLENRKSKEAVDMCNFEKHGKHDGLCTTKKPAKRKVREERRWWEEEEKRGNAKRKGEERARRLYEEAMRVLDEQGRSTDIKRREEAIRRERKEEKCHEVKKKKKKKNRVETQVESEDYRTIRYDRRMPERDQNAERKPFVDLGRYSPRKRHKRGEVALANILERIVEILKARYDVSYLFLKPVSKKEAPDYLDIIERPMDLSTIREKVRRLEYKHRKYFRCDVWQIAYNAHIYNDGRNPGISPLADKLLDFCDYLLVQNDESLSEAESGIDFC